MKYSEIRKMDIANGEGIRISLFVSGCKFHCKNCFNEITWDFKHGKLYTEQTEQSIIQFLSKPYVKGLSLLGGDPLWQTEEDINQLISLGNKTKSMNKTIWVWSGFTWEELSPVQHKLIDLCDVFVDGRYIDGLRDLTLKWRGSSNQRVIDVQESLKNNSVVLYKR